MEGPRFGALFLFTIIRLSLRVTARDNRELLLLPHSCQGSGKLRDLRVEFELCAAQRCGDMHLRTGARWNPRGNAALSSVPALT